MSVWGVATVIQNPKKQRSTSIRGKPRNVGSKYLLKVSYSLNIECGQIPNAINKQ